MRPNTSQFPAMAYGPRPAYGVRQTAVGMAVVAAILVAAVMATAYPVAVASILVGAVVLHRVVRTLDRFRRTRRREGRTRRVCIPKTGVCVEA